MDCPAAESVLAPVAPANRLSPVEPGERVLAVDVLRGFALLGILLVNMAFFSAPFQAVLLDQPWWSAWPDRVAQFAVRTLAEGKFYVLFSLLFGVGLAIQAQRAGERGARFARYWVRRLLVLLVIGLAHLLLLWYGDILTAYALAGFVLLLFYKRRDKTALIGAAIVYVLPILAAGALAALIELGRTIPQAAAEMERGFAEQETWLAQLAKDAVQNYGHGTWAQVFHQRLLDLGCLWPAYFFLLPMIVAMFLVGMVVGRRGILHEPERHLRLLRALACAGLPVGLLCSLAYTVLMEGASQICPTWNWYLAEVLHVLGSPLLGFGYAAILVLLLRAERWRVRLLPVAALGRMALTNYLLQTVICTTIFYSFGLGLFGRIGPALGVLLTLAIYALQVPLSVWWLRRFQFGPLEWLWRSLTYGRVQPLRTRPMTSAQVAA